MPTISFETTLENGVIHVPKEYITLFPETLTVTLGPIHRPKTNAKPNSIDDFPAVLDINGFKFNRDEANERLSLSIH